MKSTTWTIATLLITGVILLQGSRISYTTEVTSVYYGNIEYPETVKKVIDQKCYGCHSIEGKSDDAKKALMWDNIPNLDKGKLVATLNHIIEVLEDGTMPPEDVVKKYPEAKLLPEESKILKDWAEKTAETLLN
jgi:hypothetical protein